MNQDIDFTGIERAIEQGGQSGNPQIEKKNCFNKNKAFFLWYYGELKKHAKSVDAEVFKQNYLKMSGSDRRAFRRRTERRLGLKWSKKK